MILCILDEPIAAAGDHSDQVRANAIRDRLMTTLSQGESSYDLVTTGGYTNGPELLCVYLCMLAGTYGQGYSKAVMK